MSLIRVINSIKTPGSLGLIGFSIILLMNVIACENEKNKINELYLHSVLDTCQKNSVLAWYKDEEAFSLFVVNGIDSGKLVKHTYREFYPVFIDTLVQEDKYNFFSKRLGQWYSFTDSTVELHYIERMVHPCYNWQGQAPVKRHIQLRYQRHHL